ncbi:MAG: hybrid sensor histidine kinase/response regulator [Anaerolineae bacterium]|nr:hybrid sensor histidine kinase/response regulator [Anaerolineae bacterium]
MGVLTNSEAQDTRLAAEELSQQVVTAVTLGMALLSGLAATLTITDLYYGERPFLVFFSLFAEGCAAYYCRERCPWASHVILLFGPTLSLAMALQTFDSPAVPFFALLIVTIASAISPGLGLMATVLNTIPLCALLPRSELLYSALLLLWLAAGLHWLSSRGLHTALQWALNSEQRATRLLEELRDRQGRLNQTLAALTEATRRLQRTGYELAVARMRAEEARRLKEQLAANISHELRTPLNLVLGFSEVMYLSPQVYGDMEWPSALRRDVRQIYQSSRQLLDLVNDIIDLARVDRLQMPVHKEPCDLEEVIREAVDTIADLARRRELELRADIREPLPVLTFDRTRIRQVLLNLLNNAVRFTDRGSVTVTATAAEREVTVSVSDTGVGIPADKLARVFDEFYQVGASLGRPGDGTGLGLAISKRFVELHGGRIWAESQEGKGSCFHFTLPVSESASARGLLAGRTPDPQPGGYEPSVVVVDSDPSVAALLSRYLQGYRVVQAEGLAQVEDLVARWHPRALLLNGAGAGVWERAHAAAARLPSSVPVLVCSLPSRSQLALGIGAYACLSKPVTREQLLGVLDGLGNPQDLLIVDDDRGFVQLVLRLLGSTDRQYRLRWAYEGEEALAAIRQSRPDVLLLDLVMPGMDGFHLLEVLRSDEALRLMPVIVVTATDYAQERTELSGDTIGLRREQGFRPSEVVRYLQAILDVTEHGYPAGNGPALSAVDPG